MEALRGQGNEFDAEVGQSQRVVRGLQGFRDTTVAQPFPPQARKDH
jgi:hypothetical protein